MASNSSASTLREETPHVAQTSRTNTIVSALKRRAQAVLNDGSINAETRAIIRYALETNDPWLAELVRGADDGEDLIDNMQRLKTNGDDASEERITALTEIICQAGGQSSAALLVLMATLENAPHPKALANAAKHLAFTRCGELNICGMVDAQISVLEGELLTGNTLTA